LGSKVMGSEGGGDGTTRFIRSTIAGFMNVSALLPL
jgi:hypothetical protein